MKEISAEEIIQRIRVENPWWIGNHTISQSHRDWKPRAYFDLFFPLVKTQSVRRAVVLMGPRRVGKTVMIHHAIQALLDEGVRPESICYFSVDHPIYNGLSVEKLLSYYGQASGVDYKSEQVYIFFDEIQYLREWEIHLKSAVDTYSNIKSIASGSAAAALRLKSAESGAGRFTDFLLPPLTFYEYLNLTDQTNLMQETSWEKGGGSFFLARDIEKVNEQFLYYLNFGGYPEVIFSPQIQSDPARFIKSDIIDKVLLRDLPSLYGIGDIQELNYLFTTLAFNTANEISLEELSKNSGVAKNTIKKYIEYLEAAFLIKVVHRVDHNAKRFRRANYFKVYLTNPSMRAALFSPLKADDSAIGSLAETAIFSQWFHSGDTTLYYARWQDGEVDIVRLGTEQKVKWAVEVKWSDRYCDKPEELKSLVSFCHENRLNDVLVTSRTKTINCKVEGINMRFVPASLYCYTVGYNLIRRRKNLTLREQLEIEAPEDQPDNPLTSETT
ncbi:MAG: ATPase [Acidobacteria bacterium RIFCSPLOWO2_12_FULL_54_10]|nr:MAG: ATPase [Acidobacteria bacterium RIFCSPLOWO2_12_FULL_54_10]